jgi:hypothetical protein
MKRNGFISVSLLMPIIVVTLVFASGVSAGVSVVTHMTTNVLKLDCDAIDRALELWAKGHQSVAVDSIVYDTNGIAHYNRNRLYPENLTELGEVQGMGYFVSQTIDLSKFTYTTADGGTIYTLGVTLPNGTVYTSPRSNH